MPQLPKIDRAKPGPLLGLGISYPSVGALERIGSDWDWIWIDAQHGDIDISEAAALVRTADQSFTALAHDVDIRLDITLRSLEPDTLAGLSVVRVRQSALQFVFEEGNQTIVEIREKPRLLQVGVHSGKR